MKRWKSVAALFLAVTMMLGTVCTVDAGTQSAATVTRLSGATRYDTAASILRTAFPNGADEAVLVSGAKFPDALSAAGYAGRKKCPVMITNPRALSAQTQKLIRDFGVKKVTIVGSTSAVFSSVEKTLTGSCGISKGNISRIYGNMRAETAEEVAKAGSFDRSGACIITSGARPADALSISPWAYAKGWPVLLADGKGGLRAQTLAIAQEFQKVYVLGDENAVSAAAFSKLPNAVRISGKSRYETSVSIAETFGGNYQHAVFASGRDAHFPDPLVGGILAGTMGVPLILVDGISGKEFDFVSSKFAGVTAIYVLGGTESVPLVTTEVLRSTCGKKETDSRILAAWSDINKFNNTRAGYKKNSVSGSFDWYYTKDLSVFKKSYLHPGTPSASKTYREIIFSKGPELTDCFTNPNAPEKDLQSVYYADRKVIRWVEPNGTIHTYNPGMSPSEFFGQAGIENLYMQALKETDYFAEAAHAGLL